MTDDDGWSPKLLLQLTVRWGTQKASTPEFVTNSGPVQNLSATSGSATPPELVHRTHTFARTRKQHDTDTPPDPTTKRYYHTSTRTDDTTLPILTPSTHGLSGQAQLTFRHTSTRDDTEPTPRNTFNSCSSLLPPVGQETRVSNHPKHPRRGKNGPAWSVGWHQTTTLARIPLTE
ncbi:hypothetical protein BaRGS_00008338 [Batillaria attramentaria]|uniref:Uncharacterized protein n=1 Tax=Batillaria attramentaria TaxID=370345 RepID=A0ABD0LMF9_9CAEN